MNTVTSNEVKNDMSSYEFTYTNNSGVIFGQSYDNKLDFIYGNNHYYFNGDNDKNIIL